LYLRLGLSCSFLFLATSCEFRFDPSTTGEAPASPGETWKKYETIKLPPPYPVPYDESDLSKEMTVQELLDIALYNNPSTRSSWYAARAAAFAYRASLSEYYPTIDYSGTITSLNSSVTSASGGAAAIVATPGGGVAAGGGANTTGGSTQISTIFNELTFSYLMLDFGGRDAQAEQALQALYGANWQHNFTMQQVMLNVLNAYTSYIGNKGLVEANEQDLKDAEVAVKAAQTMFKAGLQTLTDVLQAQTSLEQAKFNLEQARGAEKTSYADLMIILGMPATRDLNIKDIPEELPVVNISGDIDSLLSLAKKKNPQLGVALSAVNELKEELIISYSAGMPVVTGNATLSRLHFIHNSASDGHENSVSINVSAPIFQGFFFINQQQEIRAQIQEALANLDVQMNAIATSVVTNYYAFITAVASLPSSEAALHFSERAYKGFLAQYKVGTASIIDVLNSLTVLSNARAQVIVNRTQWAASLANLAFSVGLLEDTSGHFMERPPTELSINNETVDPSTDLNAEAQRRRDAQENK
jgi:outer membrane protein TolC